MEENQIRLLAKLNLQTPESTSMLLHHLRLWGVARNVCSDPIFPVLHLPVNRVLEVLTNEDEFRTVFPSSECLFRNDASGLTVLQNYRDGLRAETNGEGHRGQLLFVLAENNIIAEQPIRFRGQQKSVADLVRSLAASARRDASSPQFLALALAHYSREVEVNVDFGLLFDQLTQMPLGEGWCQGIHNCYAIAGLLRIDEQTPLINKERRERGVSYLQNAIGSLETSQHADGAWRVDWSTGTATSSSTISSAIWGDAILATGHHLEWLAIVPRGVSPPTGTFLAKQFIETQFRVHGESDLLREYLPWSHAARAWVIWSSIEKNTRRQDFTSSTNGHLLQ